MVKSELVNELYVRNLYRGYIYLRKGQLKDLVSDVFEILAEKLKEGERISLPYIGTLEVKDNKLLVDYHPLPRKYRKQQ